SSLISPPPPRSTLFPYTTLFRSGMCRILHRHQRRLTSSERKHGSPATCGAAYGSDLADDPRAEQPPRAGSHDVEGNRGEDDGGQDRKSTRLNSSHLGISYAVFCL